MPKSPSPSSVRGLFMRTGPDMNYWDKIEKDIAAKEMKNRFLNAKIRALVAENRRLRGQMFHYRKAIAHLALTESD